VKVFQQPKKVSLILSLKTVEEEHIGNFPGYTVILIMAERNSTFK